MTSKERGECLYQPQKWNYEQLKAYLFLLLRKPKETILSLDQFPEIIELPEGLHEVLNQMRDQSLDKHERFSVIGSEQNSHSTYLSATIIKAEIHKVPPEIVLAERNKANKNALEVIVTNHSHATDSDYPNQSFSAGDLYNIISPNDPSLKAICLAERNINMLAFPSKETALGVDPMIFSQDTFVNF